MVNKIEITALCKNIKSNQVLSDVTLTFEGGKIYGLIGKNGSGKTMLIRSMAGLMRPTSGEIKYNDKILYKDIDLLPSVGIVIENIGLYPEFTGFNNLKLLADIKKIIGESEIKSSLEAVGLDPNDKRKVKKYSLGMRQKLVLAQAFMEHPQVVLLDEPTNGLDEDSVGGLHKLCRESAKNDAIVVLASHSKEDIEELCDEKILIKNGVCEVL